MTIYTYLGLDVSLSKTGLAFIRSDGTFSTWVIETDSKLALQNRLADITQSITLLMHQEGPPYLTVVERGFSGGQGPTAWLIGAAAGAAISCCNMHGLELELVPPKVRAKLATGKGNADKTSVLIAARERLGYQGTSYDEADALWLALAAMYIDMACPVPWQLPQSHWDVLAPYTGEPA